MCHETAEAKLRKEKAAHEEQSHNLIRQLERLQGEKRKGDREIGTLRASLKGWSALIFRLHLILPILCSQ